MLTWHLARGGIQKSIAGVQADFSSPRRFSVPKQVSTQTSEPARRVMASKRFATTTPIQW